MRPRRFGNLEINIIDLVYLSGEGRMKKALSQPKDSEPAQLVTTSETCINQHNTSFRQLVQQTQYKRVLEFPMFFMHASHSPYHSSICNDATIRNV